MSPLLIDRLLTGAWETFVMIGVSSLITLLLGIPLALILVATARDGIFAARWANSVLGSVVNVVRSIPFLILMVAMIPITRLLVGTSYGVWAALVPLSAAAGPICARIAEVSPRAPDR